MLKSTWNPHSIFFQLPPIPHLKTMSSKYYYRDNGAEYVKLRPALKIWPTVSMTTSSNIFRGSSVKHVISCNPFRNIVHLTDEGIVQGHMPGSRDLNSGWFQSKAWILYTASRKELTWKWRMVPVWNWVQGKPIDMQLIILTFPWIILFLVSSNCGFQREGSGWGQLL